MVWNLDNKFRQRENQAILTFIERTQPSAHDDIASVLTTCAKRLTDVQWYCPDVHQYAYFVLHTRSNIIFAIAFGMAGIVFRLSQQKLNEAVADGGIPFEEIGNEWIRFDPSHPKLTHWCSVAYTAVQ